MAARKAKTATPVVTETVPVFPNTELLVQLFVILESFESTEDEPTATVTITDELNRQNGTSLTAAEVYELLDSMVGMVDAVRGEWFITFANVNEENAEELAREWLKTPTQYAVRHPETVVESQTGLTRTQIAEELPTVVLETPMSDAEHFNVHFGTPLPAPTLHPAIEAWEPTEHEATIPDFEGPETIPAPPAGVNGNVWFMSFYANTETARKFWRDRVATQLAEYDALDANDHLMANMGC